MTIRAMNWMQVEAYLAQDVRCIVPLGPVEQLGGRPCARRRGDAAGDPGQTTVVTGAAPGIGRGLAHAFALSGDHLWAFGVRAEALVEATKGAGSASREPARG